MMLDTLTYLASAMAVPSQNLTLIMSGEFAKPLSVDFSSEEDSLLGIGG